MASLSGVWTSIGVKNPIDRFDILCQLFPFALFILVYLEFVLLIVWFNLGLKLPILSTFANEIWSNRCFLSTHTQTLNGKCGLDFQSTSPLSMLFFFFVWFCFIFFCLLIDLSILFHMFIFFPFSFSFSITTLTTMMMCVWHQRNRFDICSFCMNEIELQLIRHTYSGFKFIKLIFIYLRNSNNWNETRLYSTIFFSNNSININIYLL